MNHTSITAALVPTSVGHADDNALAVEVGDAIDHGLHARNERLTALQAKALGSSVSGM
jgi:hypothetical protein